MKEEYNYDGETPAIEDLMQCSGKLSFIKTNYPDFYEYINSNVYGKTFIEKLYCYYHDIHSQQVCPFCGTAVKFECFNSGYKKTCGEYDCVKKSAKQTNLIKYGAENPFASEVIKGRIANINIERYGVKYPMQSKSIRDKSENTFMQKYGVKHYLQCDEGKQKIKSKVTETNKKRAITCNERYGGIGFGSDSLNKKTRKILNERYGTPNFTTTSEYKSKAYTTRKKHNTFNSSAVEEEFTNWLNDNHIEFIRQYKTDIYPYPCDFYFPDKDLYFEINGTWTHGKHRFDPTNEGDLEILNNWKNKNTRYYDIAIKVWTKTDPEKYEIAQKHKLNWVSVYSMDINEIINTYRSK